MGVSWKYVLRMEELGAFARPGLRVLDVGSSNLYDADAAEMAAFIRRHAEDPGAELEAFCARLAKGSVFARGGGSENGAFLGELLQRAGFRYASVDIAAGWGTRILDLNRATLPPDMAGAYGLVLNFGTTEHILNQMNCFRAIHEATEVGGIMVHQLPAQGHVDHGYFGYTGRFFFDLAGYNAYHVLDAWLSLGDEEEDPYASFRAYQEVFPALKRRLETLDQDEEARAIAARRLPVLGINVVCRKTAGLPFLGTVETSTSFGEIPEEVFAGYRVE
jgi:hypothetical protein